MSPRGLLIAAPASGAGKTTVTLGLLRALRQEGHRVAGAKSGPDYIDPQFHEAACGAPSVTLDAWAMDPGTLRARGGAIPAELLIVEGAMGALDAAADGRGSAADLAATLGLPLLLVIDIAKQAQSTPLAAAGLRALRPDLPLAGAILNRAGSPRHGAMARAAMDAAGIPVLGTLPRRPDLTLPERHLGLVQAQELPELEAALDRLAALVREHVDLAAIAAAMRPVQAGGPPRRLAPLGQRIAVARDAAFAFAYPHLLADWRAQGASLHPFSPLADEAPDAAADAIFLPGGYPELHAPRLAANHRFRAGMEAAAPTTRIYGECGGYMALGDALIDADGRRHRMLGLLPLTTSFATRKLTLGYRHLAPRPGAPWSGPLAAHEFHYATIVEEGDAARLFDATDATGAPLPPMGLARSQTSGSFAHIIAPARA
ncbi:MAG: cobyrinate a,c-diamide synthase [Pseudomonadota bacterium]